MTVGVPLPDAPPNIADRPVFTADGVAFTVADLVRRARVGTRDAPATASTSAQVEEGFRRSRGLLRADQLEAWLAGWEIAADDFRRWTEDVVWGTSGASGWCALVCSGSFDAVTSELVSAAAAACELGSSPVDAAGFDEAGWTERLIAAGTTSARLTAAIENHRLSWTRLTVTRVATNARGVAEELRHRVLSDGVHLGSAAVLAGIAVEEVTQVLADVNPPALRATLAGAQTGELVGPLPVPGSWIVISVLSRTAATLADPETRARAAATVRAEVIADAVARHVVA
ncbi:MAG: hypothetical protein JWQ32_1904 [Marmoricola sp.]|nr:hypothetical protein [Marmoricola sp.]